MMNARLADPNRLADVFIAHRVQSDLLDQILGDVEDLGSGIPHATILLIGRQKVKNRKRRPTAHPLNRKP
jgi:hypothetical protein